MPNIISDLTFTTARGNAINIYRGDKLNKPYFNKLKTNINSFLNKAKNANADGSDVRGFLETRKFINDGVEGNQEFRDLLNSRVPANRIGLKHTPIKKTPADEAVDHLMTIRTKSDPDDEKEEKHKIIPFMGKQITQQDLINELEKVGKLPEKKTAILNDTLKGLATRHNDVFTDKERDKFTEKYPTAQHQYTLTFEAVVFNEQRRTNENENKGIYKDKQYFKFYSDLTKNKITEKKLKS